MPSEVWHAAARTLAALTLDAFLLARHSSPEHSSAGGRAWERAVSQLLWRPGITQRQHAGVLGLFGEPPQSGADHEIDAAGRGPDIDIWIECKARTVNKSDIAVFQLKCFDFYRAAASGDPEQTAKVQSWPLLVSSEPAGATIRRICCDLGVVLCDPQRLPIPALLFAASRPNADDYIPGADLGELARLAETASAPMQERWTLDVERRMISLSLDGVDATDIDDLLFLQDEVSEDLFDALEVHAPGVLDHRAAALVQRLEAAQIAS